LSKWIEKGKKNCPLCRKEIQENVISINRGTRPPTTGEYIFRFSLSSRLFSWLPNLTIRFGRPGSNLPRMDNLNSTNNNATANNNFQSNNQNNFNTQNLNIVHENNQNENLINSNNHS
jgi:hypothetical protein